jgi:hypothetical protein
MIYIKDDFLTPDEFKGIEDMMLSEDFPWYYNDYRTYFDDGDLQFVHGFYFNGIVQSRYFDVLLPLIKKIDIKSIVKIKANMTLKGTRCTETLHTDVPFECNTGIFYINDNNGKTKFEDGFVADSKKNRYISFNSQLKHTGTIHTDTKRRIVLNFNYF